MGYYCYGVVIYKIKKMPKASSLPFFRGMHEAIEAKQVDLHKCDTSGLLSWQKILLPCVVAENIIALLQLLCFVVNYEDDVGQMYWIFRCYSLKMTTRFLNIPPLWECILYLQWVVMFFVVVFLDFYISGFIRHV